MILDARDNLRQYRSLFRGADPDPLFEWLLGPSEFVPGSSLAFAADRLLAKVLDLETGPAQGFRWETHRDHVDLQFILGGGEIIAWSPRATLLELGVYDASSDVQFYSDAPPVAQLSMRPGLFAFFSPTDAHKPCVSDGTHGRVLKVVVKIPRALVAL